MHFNIALCLSLAASLATAIILPEGLPSGVHAVDIDENGNHTFRFLGDYLQDGPTHSAKFRRQTVTPLPAGQMGCTGNGIPYSDLASAEAQMYAYCGASASIQHQMLTFSNGNAFTYTCRYTDSNTCAAGEAQAAFALLSNGCGAPGSPVGGWYWLKDWAKNYGYDVAGADVCTNLPSCGGWFGGPC